MNTFSRRWCSNMIYLCTSLCRVHRARDSQRLPRDPVNVKTRTLGFILRQTQTTLFQYLFTDEDQLLSDQRDKLHLIEPPQKNSNKMARAPSEDSDQPGHPPSLIRVFAVRMKKAWVLSYPLSASKDSDQTGRIPRLI